MAKTAQEVRVHELAKELCIPSKELVERLKKMGMPVKGHMSVLPALVNVLTATPRGLRRLNHSMVIFSDELNHASVIQGIRAAGCPVEAYRHCDAADLAERLSHYPAERRKLIITDGVFSMDGDIAPLPKLVELARAHGASLFMDDAHGIGVLGPDGRGTEDHFGLRGTVQRCSAGFLSRPDSRTAGLPYLH